MPAGRAGQNVNKVATAVQLFFPLMASPSLPDHVKRNAARIAGRKLSKDGVLMVEANRFRSQERNREDALRTAEGVDPGGRCPAATEAAQDTPHQGVHRTAD